MVKIVLDDQHIEAEEGWTVLDTARQYGIDIPTLCYMDGMSAYSACRLCIVELVKGERSRLVTSCSCPVKGGMVVKTNSARVKKARKMIIELMLASCPNSRILQCMASEYGITKIRFKSEDRECLLCGLCVRVCKEQMLAGAIGFAHRGTARDVIMPFHMRSDLCRECGACQYVCPVGEIPCIGPLLPGELCNACLDTVRLEDFPGRD